MIDALPTDGARRFTFLPAELVARVVIAAGAGLALSYVWNDLLPWKSLWWQEVCNIRLIHRASPGRQSVELFALLYAPSLRPAFAMVVMLAFASAAAKKGLWVVPACAAAAAASLGAGIGGGRLLGGGGPGLVMGVALVGAGVGLAEGLFERSVATIYAGLLGGALSGAAVGFVVQWAYVTCEAGYGGAVAAGHCMQFALLHVGVGLSLAAGRYIRDLPKERGPAPAGPLSSE